MNTTHHDGLHEPANRSRLTHLVKSRKQEEGRGEPGKGPGPRLWMGCTWWHGTGVHWHPVGQPKASRPAPRFSVTLTVAQTLWSWTLWVRGAERAPWEWPVSHACGLSGQVGVAGVTGTADV